MNEFQKISPVDILPGKMLRWHLGILSQSVENLSNAPLQEDERERLLKIIDDVPGNTRYGGDEERLQQIRARIKAEQVQ